MFPPDPFPVLQYLPGIGCCWFGKGSCTARLLRFDSRRAHVTKINTEIEADVTLGQHRESGSGSKEVKHELVKYAILSEVCLLTAEIALQRLSSFPFLFFLSCWSAQLPEEAAFDCIDLKKNPLLPIWRKLGLTCTSLKRDVILDVNADHEHSAAPLTAEGFFGCFVNENKNLRAASVVWALGGAKLHCKNCLLLY